jgi:hypothetical protein
MPVAPSASSRRQWRRIACRLRHGFRADPRQQQREAERPTQQVQRRRLDLGAQRTPGDEVAGP